MHSLSFDMTKLACTRMDLLAAGMGVDPPAPGEGGDRLGAGMGGGGEELGVEGFDGGKFLGVNDGARREGKMLALTPGSAEEWIARQGHEGMLLC